LRELKKQKKKGYSIASFLIAVPTHQIYDFFFCCYLNDEKMTYLTSSSTTQKKEEEHKRKIEKIFYSLSC